MWIASATLWVENSHHCRIRRLVTSAWCGARGWGGGWGTRMGNADGEGGWGSRMGNADGEGGWGTRMGERGWGRRAIGRRQISEPSRYKDWTMSKEGRIRRAMGSPRRVIYCVNRDEDTWLSGHSRDIRSVIVVHCCVVCVRISSLILVDRRLLGILYTILHHCLQEDPAVSANLGLCHQKYFPTRRTRRRRSDNSPLLGKKLNSSVVAPSNDT